MSQSPAASGSGSGSGSGSVSDSTLAGAGVVPSGDQQAIKDAGAQGIEKKSTSSAQGPQAQGAKKPSPASPASAGGESGAVTSPSAAAAAAAGGGSTSASVNGYANVAAEQSSTAGGATTPTAATAAASPNITTGTTAGASTSASATAAASASTSTGPEGADGKDKDILASELHSTLRRRRSTSTVPACDSCRSLKARCDRKDPCSRCVQTGKICTRNHVLLKTGRISRAERTAFELSGLNFKTWRQRLKDQRKEYGYEMRVSADGKVRRQSSFSDSSSMAGGGGGSRIRGTSANSSGGGGGGGGSNAGSGGLSFADVIMEESLSPSGSGSSDRERLMPPPRPSARAPWTSNEGGGGGSPSLMSMETSSTASDSDMTASLRGFSPLSPGAIRSLGSAFAGGGAGSGALGSFMVGSGEGSSPSLWGNGPSIASPTWGEAFGGYDNRQAAPSLQALPDEEVEGLFFEPLFSSADTTLKVENWEVAAINEDEKPVLYLQPNGALRFVNDHESRPSVRELFAQDWVTTGAGNLPLEPPWALLHNNPNVTTAITLWPISNLDEKDFEALKQRGYSMLSTPCAITLIKRYFATQHLVFPYMYSPTVLHFLETTLIAARGGSCLWTPLQVRQRQALLLAIAAAAAFIDETHFAKIHGSDKKVRYHSRDWAWEATKLSYALCQPRRGIFFEDDERTLDLALMGRTWLLLMGYHPCLEGVVVLMSRHFIGDPGFHSAMIQKHGYRISEMEQWKRIVNDAFMAQNHHKLWKDINYDLDIGPVVQVLGPLRLIPGELLDEGMDGGSSRLCMWFYFQDTKFQFILDQLCRSSLCKAPNGLDPVGLAAQQEIDAEIIFNRVKQWNEETFNPPKEFQSTIALKNAQEKLAVRYMMFSARAKLSAALDLIMCTLENDDLGLQELRSTANPAADAPSEVDKVAEWISNSFFYKTEKSYMMQSGRDGNSASPPSTAPAEGGEQRGPANGSNAKAHSISPSPSASL